MGSKNRRNRGQSSQGAQATPQRAEPECANWRFWRSRDQTPEESRVRKDFMDPRVIPKDAREEFIRLMGLYKDRRQDLRAGVHYKQLQGDIWELRYKRNRNPYRLIFARWGNVPVALDVFYKNQQQTDFSRAAGRYKQWKQWWGDTP